MAKQVPCMKSKKRARPRKTMKKKPEKHVGKASCMPGQLWPLWLGHVHSQGTCWLHACLLLTHVLCLRVTEALKLKASDFNWSARSVHIGALKRQKPWNKPMLSVILPLLRRLRDKGLACKRKRGRGVLGKKAFEDVWKWPNSKDGLLFPSVRKDAKGSHRNKNTVCTAVRRLRKSFTVPKGSWLDVNKIRTHSGRHRMVNDLKLAAVPDDIAMMYARIADPRLMLMWLVYVLYIHD